MAELRSFLAAVRGRWLAAARLSAAGRAAGAAAVPLLAAALAIQLLAPTVVWVALLTLLAPVGAATLAVLVLWRMPRRPDERQVARFCEERLPTRCAADALVSAVAAMNGAQGAAGPFAEAVVLRAAAVVRGLEIAAVIPRSTLGRAGLVAALGGATLGLALTLMLPSLQRTGALAWRAMDPDSLTVTVLPGDLRVRAGQPVVIAATLGGRGAGWVDSLPALTLSVAGEETTVPLERTADGRFTHRIDSVDRSFTYQVVAGRVASRPYAVTALFPPRVARIDVRYDYPSFAGLAPRTDEDGGDIYGPAGTKVRLLVHADKPVTSGTLTLGTGAAIELAATAGDALAAEIVLATDDGYRVRLRGMEGLESAADVEYFIRVTNDRPPVVRILRPTADLDITPLEEVAIEARAEDDYGIAALELVYGVAGRAPVVVPFTGVTGRELARTGVRLLAAEALAVAPGDVITYFARARDIGRGKRPTEATSELFFLEVRPFDGDFASAESQASGAGAAVTQVDTLIAAQKEIITATWNLERRSAAGRSAADLAAIGDAQADLQSRAEQMIGGRRREVRGVYPPQQIAEARQQLTGAREPVAAAVQAMARAVTELRQRRATSALPHEMAALQGLLQAQAAARRRQVVQQASSGVGQGGTSRTDRDLSALFDHELQRQQRTNYESAGAAADSRPAEAANSQLERVRELARRQNALAQRQRELAAAQAPEDSRQRELERLTREQEEVRRAADLLASELGARTPQRSAGAERGASDAGELRRAANDMRGAAGEMQRQNAGAAAARSQRAADALRAVEERMAAGDGSARQRAAGAMTLEAQQMAESQRRLVNERERIGKGQPGADETVRRLAVDQAALADRVDRWQRAAAQLGRDMPGAQGEAFRDAAAAIASGKLSDRMRSAARSHGARRSPSDPGESPTPERAQRAEQQLARALDAVVDTLAGDSQAEARKLTDQLDRSRAVRERLDRLARQVREAEAKAAGEESRLASAPQSGRPERGTPARGRGEATTARQAYARELERARGHLGRPDAPARGGQGATPTAHEYSRSSAGTEGLHQDFSAWEALRAEVNLAIEEHETALVDRLAGLRATARLSGGGRERVPDAYRPLVSKYFEAIAKGKP